MRKEIGGLMFEAAVIRVLRRDLECDVYASDWLDFEHKIDGEIRSIGGKPLGRLVQIQLTRRIDHYTKMRKWIRSRWSGADVVNLYVEAEETVPAREVAEGIAWAAEVVQWLAPYEPRSVRSFGLRVGDDAVFFDPYARRDALRAEWQSEERLRALKRGVAHDFVPSGFRVWGEDGVERFAHFIEIDNGSFRHQLRLEVGNAEAEVPIYYLPFGKFVRDVRPRLIAKPASPPPDLTAESAEESPPSEETDPSRP